MRRGAGKKLTAALTLFLALTASASSYAEPTAADKESARSMMRDGDAAFRKRDYQAALEAYRGANAIIAVPTTAVAIARARAALGQLNEARDAALSVGRMPEQPGEPKAFVKARAEAKELAVRLTERIPKLEVRVSGLAAGTSYRLKIDDEVIPDQALGLPRRVNPGRHVVTASAEGYRASHRTVSVEEGETKAVEIELEADWEPKARRGSAERPRTQDSGGGSTTSPLVYVGFGVAAVGVVVGSVSGWMSISKASSAKEHCVGNACTPEARDDLDASLTLATVSDVSFGAALVGAAVGVVALMSSGKSSPERVARAPRSIRPVMSPRFIGMAGSF
jgi:hypothetical protein